jgi:uncharacterized protein YwgA
MQKLAYFAGLGLGTPLGHRPHFYGPYSSRVEDALEQAVIAGHLHETVERISGWSGDEPDVLKYTYDLTAEGRKRTAVLISAHKQEAQRISSAVDAIRSVLPSLNQKMLSSAAKAYLILNESDGPVREDEIPDLARRLGWELTPAQVTETVKLLENLGLVDST